MEQNHHSTLAMSSGTSVGDSFSSLAGLKLFPCLLLIRHLLDLESISVRAGIAVRHDIYM